MLAQALRGIFSDLDRAMKVFHGDPSAPERHRRLDAAIRDTHAARFIALAKDEPNERLANRIEELRTRGECNGRSPGNGGHPELVARQALAYLTTSGDSPTMELLFPAVRSALS